MCEGARNGNISVVQSFVDRGACRWNRGMKEAIAREHKHTMEYFIDKGASDWVGGFHRAVMSGNSEFVEYFRPKLAKHNYMKEQIPQFALYRTVKEGNLESISKALRELSPSSIARCILQATQSACQNGRQDIVELLATATELDWRQLLAASCSSGNRQLVELVIHKGNPNGEFLLWWNHGMRGAISNGHLELMHLMIEKGANDWEVGLQESAATGNLELVEFFLEKGAKEVNRALQRAISGA